MDELSFIAVVIGILSAFIIGVVVRKQQIEIAYLQLLRSVDDRVATRLHQYYVQATPSQQKAVRALLAGGEFIADLTALEEDDHIIPRIVSKIEYGVD